MTTANRSGNWEKSQPSAFWGQVAARDHIVQIYDDEDVVLDTLEGFVTSGFLNGDSVVIIATNERISILEKRLLRKGFDLHTFLATDQYITLDAVDTLSSFIINDWPDKKLFEDFITIVIKRAQKDNRKVRAFGEMVAILWEKGFNEATIQLENLWHDLHTKVGFSLYCAYPRNGFHPAAAEAIEKICCAHSMVIDGQPASSTEIYYKSA